MQQFVYFQLTYGKKYFNLILCVSAFDDYYGAVQNLIFKFVLPYSE